MNGIEKITARIEGDAKAEAENLLAETEAQVRQLNASYDQQAQDAYWKLIRAGVKDVEARAQRLGSTAEMEAKKSVLAMKQEMVSLAFKRAQELIAEMPAAEYTAFLAKLAAQASMNGMEEIIVNPRDRSVASAAVKQANAALSAKGRYGKLTLSEETRAITGGLILKQGDIEANCSIETLTEQYRNELSAQVADLMFS